MKALITGASSGIGRDMANILSSLGYDIIAVARRKDRLNELAKQLNTNVEAVVCDVTNEEECKALARYASEVDVFINNAGFGIFGDFCDTDLDTELKMIDTNVRAVHILTKIFAKEFDKRGHGYILNVSSLASFFPGPRFGAYYATKAYVLRLTQALCEELRVKKSKVVVSTLCPGPVNTEFSDVAKVSFGTGKEKFGRSFILDSEYVARYAIRNLFKGKNVIIPGRLMKLAVFSRHFLSDKAIAKVVYVLQTKKIVAKDTSGVDKKTIM